MFVLSTVLDLLSQYGGPRLAFAIHLKRLARWRTAEPEYYLLRHLVDPSRASVDVGAHEGVYSGRLAQLCRRVHAFEPNPRLAAALRHKVRRKVVVHQCALSDYSGTAVLRVPYLHGEQLSLLSTLESSNTLACTSDIRSEPCCVSRLDDVVHEAVGFVKIDVEGHELAVLEGARQIISVHLPVLLIESMKRHNPAAPEHIFRFLSDMNYYGYFFARGKLNPIACFQAERDQCEAKRGTADYVVNFIFVPTCSSQRAALP